MLRLSNFTNPILLAAFFLLLTGCVDDKETNFTTATQSAQSNPIQEDINGLKNLMLTIEKTTLNKDENTTVTVMATYEDGTSKEMTNKVEWVITPENSVAIAGKILSAKKDNRTTLNAKLGTVLSNSMDLDITWIVNGHKLPPEPDKTVNDSTLLGVDVNGNGVRDDVERYIYERFGKDPEYPKTKIALAMQDAWATQKVLENPVIESDKYYADALACQSYWMRTKINKLPKVTQFSLFSISMYQFVTEIIIINLRYTYIVLLFVLVLPFY